MTTGSLPPPSTILRQKPPQQSLAMSSLPPPPHNNNTSHRIANSFFRSSASSSSSSATIFLSSAAVVTLLVGEGGGVTVDNDHNDSRAVTTKEDESTTILLDSHRSTLLSRILPHRMIPVVAGWPPLAYPAAFLPWIVTTTTTTTTTTCEPQATVEPEATTQSSRNADKASASTDVDSNDNNNDDNHGVDDDMDPYDNLPEHDEDTHCSMCNTFRQGPCRPYWRKLERCFKDHENEENGAVKCMKYFAAHQQCLQQYLNLYQLVSLHMKQELVRDTDRAVAKDERQNWNVDIDWGLWKQFVQEQGPDWKQTIRRTDENNSSGKDQLLPLWQRLPENTEPVLLTLHSPLPQRKEGMILKIAYALDQDGFVLGFSYNPAYQALMEQSVQSAATGTNTATAADGPASSAPPSDASDTSSDPTSVNEDALTPTTTTGGGSDDDNESYKLEFVLLPGETHSIRICAMYSENPVTASPEKDLLDVILYTSSPHPVTDGAR